jgi:hypothetical protein
MPSRLVEVPPFSDCDCRGFYHDYDCVIGILVWHFRLDWWWKMQHPIYLFASAIS